MPVLKILYENTCVFTILFCVLYEIMKKKTLLIMKIKKKNIKYLQFFFFCTQNWNNLKLKYLKKHNTDQNINKNNNL